MGSANAAQNVGGKTLRIFIAILDTIRSTLDSVFIVSLRAEWYGFELATPNSATQSTE